MNKNIIWTLVVIIILIGTGMILQNKYTLFNAYHYDTQPECLTKVNILRQNNYPCVIDCFKMTSSIHNCVSNYGYTGYNDNIGEWYAYYDADYSCYDYYGAYRILEKEEPRDIGLYNCVPVFRDAVGDLETPQTCRTSADTNCDGIVSRDELGVTINQWIAGSITRDKLGEYIVAWLS
jgi:hypothetical protein